jgi:hypothetical protein
MEIRNGFIVGIFNYCDRWCATCAFTSHCRLFADGARLDAAHDPAMRAVVEAAPLPQDIPPPPPQWLSELIEKAEEDAGKMSAEELKALTPRLPPQHVEMNERAMAYFAWVHDLLQQQPERHRVANSDPLAVVDWFSSFIPPKIYRALTGLAEFDGDREFQPDHEGSAKIALIGIDRSLEAWRALVQSGRFDAQTVAHCMTELTWLREQLDQAVPLARAFVRPGFDEPEAVANLGVSD